MAKETGGPFRTAPPAYAEWTEYWYRQSGGIESLVAHNLVSSARTWYRRASTDETAFRVGLHVLFGFHLDMSCRLRCAKVLLPDVDVYPDGVNRCPMERLWRCDDNDNSRSVRLMSWVGIGAIQGVIVDCRSVSGDDFHRSVIIRARTLCLKERAFQRSCAIDQSCQGTVIISLNTASRRFKLTALRPAHLVRSPACREVALDRPHKDIITTESGSASDQVKTF